MYSLLIGDKSGDPRHRVNFSLLFRGASFFTTDISHIFVGTRVGEEIWQRYGSGQPNLFPEFCELWCVGPMIPCGDMHQSFTDTLVNWFFNNFSMLADSFSVLSIYCVAQGLGASFLYKCPVSRGGSLQQHCLLVSINVP